MSSIADDRLNKLKEGVIYHFNVDHDKNKLYEESVSCRYSAINNRNLERYRKFLKEKDAKYGVESEDKDWFEKQNDWKVSTRLDITPDTEAYRLHEMFKEVLEIEDMGPRFMTQKEGTDVKYHVDRETKCAINFLVRGDQTPISFKNIGSFYYDTALIDSSFLHAVPSQTGGDRVLFKLRINDMSYKEAKERLIAKGIVRKLRS